MKIKLLVISLVLSGIQVLSQQNPALEFFKAGEELMENHKFEEAIEPFSKAIDLNPANITFFYHRGYSFFKLRDYQSARSDFKICVGVVPNDPDYNFFLGLSESKLDNFVEALKYFNTAISMNKSKYEYFFHRGIVHLKKRDYKSSLSDFNSSIAINPNHILSYYNRGLANYKLGRNDNACIDWKIALDADANLSVKYYNKICPQVNLDEWHELHSTPNDNIVIKPAFQGGNMDSFTEYVMKNLQYPGNSSFQLNEGRVISRFVVGAKGSIDGVEILQSASKELDEEVKRVIEASGRLWDGGTVNGIPSDFKLTISLKFMFAEKQYKIEEYEASGDDSFAKNDFDSAINFYTKALELDSSNVEIHKKRIAALVKRGSPIPAEINSIGLDKFKKIYYRYNTPDGIHIHSSSENIR